ncbi:MAG: hypothetical protein ABW194_01620 [Novosphingobium sp.]
MSAAAGPWPELLTPELRKILGLICFQCAPFAHVYQAAGEFSGSEGPLQKRAEDEQAFILHKLVSLWVAHGEGWMDAFDDELVRVKAKAAQATGGRS